MLDKFGWSSLPGCGAGHCPRTAAQATTASHTLSFLYLANDVMQNTRKKTSDFVNAFGEVMGDVCAMVDGVTLVVVIDSI